MMVEGDKFEIYVPSDLGYGDNGSPPKIGPGDALVFVMEIIEIEGGKVPALKCTVDFSSGDVKSTTDCNAKEQKYAEKVASWDMPKVTKEITRLETMGKGGQMKEELLEWIN